jgi:hypothetical protein
LAPPAVLPAAPLAATLNARFNRDVTKFASLEAGVLIHQLDGFQDAELPWAPCSGSSRSHNCQGTRTSSRRHRVSCSVIFAGLHRKDASIPTFSVDAGVVLRPSMANVLCGYGNDGSIDDNRPLMCEGGSHGPGPQSWRSRVPLSLSSLSLSLRRWAAITALAGTRPAAAHPTV